MRSIAPRPLRPARQARVVLPPVGILQLNNVTVALPLEWFILPARQALAKAIRPPTARTRRKQRTIEYQIPLAAFHHFLRNFDTGELDGLEWLNDEKTALKPTDEKKTFKQYQYKLTMPSQLNKFWEMELWDKQVQGTKWRRGIGAQRLFLSQAAGQRGNTSMLTSSACGNVAVRLREPIPPSKMPTMRIVFSVLTLRPSNSILYNQTYAPRTKAALRNLVTSGLRRMVAHPDYPTTSNSEVETALALDPADEVWDPPTLLLTNQMGADG